MNENELREEFEKEICVNCGREECPEIEMEVCRKFSIWLKSKINGIQVLISRYDKEIEFLKIELSKSRELLEECLEGLNFLHIEYCPMGTGQKISLYVL